MVLSSELLPFISETCLFGAGTSSAILVGIYFLEVGWTACINPPIWQLSEKDFPSSFTKSPEV